MPFDTLPKAGACEVQGGVQLQPSDQPDSMPTCTGQIARMQMKVLCGYEVKNYVDHEHA